MKKKLLCGFLALMLMLLATGCSTTPEALTFTPESEDFKHTVALKYTITDTESKAEIGSMDYRIEKGSHETDNGTIDVIFVRSTVSMQAVIEGSDEKKTKVMETEVALYPKSFRPIYCSKKLTDSFDSKLNWESYTDYTENSIDIKLNASATEFDPSSTSGLNVPLSGVCYDSETILLLARTVYLAKGQSASLQLMNTQTGISDTTLISVNSEVQELTVTGLNGNEEAVKYNCLHMGVGATSIISRPVSYIWISDDVNRLPLKMTQVSYTYTLTEYTLG